MVKEAQGNLFAEKKRRGGARPGAGRKPVPKKIKKRPLSMSLTPQAIEILKNLEVVLKAKNPSAVVEFLVAEAWAKFEHMDPELRPDLSFPLAGV